MLIEEVLEKALYSAIKHEKPTERFWVTYLSIVFSGFSRETQEFR